MVMLTRSAAAQAPSGGGIADGRDRGRGLARILDEDQGFTGRFDAEVGVRGELTVVVGSLPADRGGSFTVKRHPRGATRVAQCVESLQQLSGVAVDQVGRARIALAHNTGGPTASSAVTSLEGPWTNGG